MTTKAARAEHIGAATSVPEQVTPFDRLPAKGPFRVPPLGSLYHTKRAEDARQRSEATLPPEYLQEAQTVLFKAGLRRTNEHYADVADHNAMTLAHALAYADSGLHVIDCHAAFAQTGRGTGPGGDMKVPRGAKWEQRATTNKAEIVKFWTGEGSYPTNKIGETFPYARVNAPRNVGIAFPTGCGLFVLDIDVKDGRTALEVLEALEGEHGELPATVESKTGGGGLHLIFRSAMAIQNTASRIARGVDIRGANGFVVAAPSIHGTGNFYRWVEDRAPWQIEIADAPEWLEKLAYNATKSRQEPAPKTVREGAPARRTISGAGFENVLALIGDGDDCEGFDGPIYRAACSWLGRNPDGDVADLKELLRDVILDAPCVDSRNESRYATDSYLDGRIEQARAYVAEQRAKEAGPTAEEMAANTRAVVAKVAEDPVKPLTDVDIKAILKEAISGDVGLTGLDDVKAELAKKTGRKTSLINALVKQARSEIKAASGTQSREGFALVNSWHFDELCNFGAKRIQEANATNPQVFHYMESLCAIRENSEGNARIKYLTKDGFAHYLNTVAKYAHATDESVRGVAAPFDVVTHLFAGDYSDYPVLRGYQTTPFFDRHGELVCEPGYHAGSKVYLAPGDLEVPCVSTVPSPEEVRDAVASLLDVIQDFPICGMGRREVTGDLTGSPNAHGVAHTLAFTLLPFYRETVQGPTPGHAWVKPAPGTGASLLLEVLTMIAMGNPASAIALQSKDEEVAKTLTSLFRNDPRFIIFDNVGREISGSELASAMTATTYQARLLGSSTTIEVAVRAVFGFTANNMQASNEVLRRFVIIPLDAHSANPEKRTPEGGWAHDDIRTFVRENRARLVWSALTIIQNWVARGMPNGDRTLASYESWSRVTGGILEAAGIPGFLEGQDAMRANAADAAHTGTQQLIDVFAEYPAGTLFRPGGSARFGNTETVSVKDVLNGEERFGSVGSANLDPIQINGWNYSAFDGCYKTAPAIAAGLRKLASKPHLTSDGSLLELEGMWDGKAKGYVYKLGLVPPPAS